MNNINDSIAVRRGLSPVASAADNTALTSEIVDTMGYSGIEFIVNIGAVPDADATFATTIAESENSNMSSSTAVATSNLDGTLVGASFQFDSDNLVRKIGIKEMTKRYVQMTVTPAANSGATLLGITVVLFGGRKVP